MNQALRLLRSHLNIGESDGRSPAFKAMYDLGFEPDYSNPNICYGGGKGSSGGTTTTTSSPPPEVMAAYEQALGMANTAASAPLQQYQGQTVAPLNNTENSAFGSINNAQGLANPYINSATNLIGQGTQPLWNGVQQFSPSNVQQYQSPYTQNVLNTTVAQEQNTDAQQQAALQGNAVSSGAWGGDRAGVASAVLSGQQDTANNATNANIENTGYTNALGEFNTQQQAQLGANEANSYLAQQGAFGMAGLGNEALSTTLSGANAQLTAGQLQQQETQANLNVPYEQFLQQQAYPFQTAQFYSGIASGLGSEMGGTSSTTTPQPSTASELGGLGLGSLGLIAMSGGFNSGADGNGAGAFSFMNPTTWAKGGAVKGYAPGGSVIPGAPEQVQDQTGIPDVSVSYVPTIQMTHGPGAPKAPNGNNGSQNNGATSASDISGISNITKAINSLSGPNSGTTSVDNSNVGGLGNVFGSGSGIDPSTGNALASQNSIDTSFLSQGNVGSSGINFQRGGTISPKYSGRYAIGGEVLPDFLTIGGDILGSFFGDPGAGGQADTALNMTTDGRIGTPQFKKGGMATGYDDGGQVGGMSPMSSQLAPQQAPSMAGNLNNMTPEQLQQYVMRLPMGSQQQKQVQAVLQQKRMMPNVGAQAQGGLGTQQPQIQQPMQQPTMARGGMARGYDGGGATDLPSPPTPDQIQQQLAVTTDGPPSSTPLSSGSQDSVPVPGAMGTKAPQTSAPASDDAKVTSRAPAKADPWLALANAGFAMAAGNSPHALQNIGAGAEVGLKNYGQQQQEADTVNAGADKLAQEAKQHKDQIAIEQQNADQEKTFQTGQLGHMSAEDTINAQKAKAEAQNYIGENALRQAQIDNYKATSARENLDVQKLPNGQIVAIDKSKVGTPGYTPQVIKGITPQDENGNDVGTTPPGSTVPVLGDQHNLYSNFSPAAQAKALDAANKSLSTDNDAANVAKDSITRLNQAKQLFQQANTGGINNLPGISQIETATSTTRQELNSLNKELALSPGERPTGMRLTQGEVTMLRDAQPGPNMLPEAGKNLADALVAMKQRPIDWANFKNDFINNNGYWNEALGRKMFNQYVDENPAFDPNVATDPSKAKVFATNPNRMSLQDYAAAGGFNNFVGKPRPQAKAAISAGSLSTGTDVQPATNTPPPEAIDMLRKNPSLAPAFEQKYGTPSSQYLGGT